MRKPNAKRAKHKPVHATRGALIQRCPCCGVDIGAGLVRGATLDAATIVARRTVEGVETSSGDVASLLYVGEGEPWAAEWSARLLGEAYRAGLVARTRHTLPEGGFAYRYLARPLLVAYLSEYRLAYALRAAFHTPPRTLAGRLAMWPEEWHSGDF